MQEAWDRAGCVVGAGVQEWREAVEGELGREGGADFGAMLDPQPTANQGHWAGDRLSCASSRENCGKCHDLNLLWDPGGAACKWGQIRQRQPNC